MICHYCQKNESLDEEIVNTYTKEMHPTCAVCKLEFELVVKTQKKYNTIKRIGNILLLGSIVGFVFYDWRVGSILLVLGGIIRYLYFELVSREGPKNTKLIKKFAKEEGLFSFHRDY
ncbi:MAG: hypothetical protein P9M13_07010 [Candidatus Ancaeobacter aquaticus]|nr:hypothetical protein [Candidatus Ancaeobacter aquaticus]